MIDVIKDENINAINKTAKEILAFLKSNKVFFTSKYDSDVRIKASTCMFEIFRTIDGSDRFLSVTAEREGAISELKALIDNLNYLLENKRNFRLFKMKEYSLETVKVKMCRELVSELEDMYVLNQIEREDINHVYATLGKPVPRKFSANDVLDENKAVYYAIRNAMKDRAEEIKTNSFNHYVKMTQRIDPNDEFNTPKEFIKAGRKSISDMISLRLCYAYKFENDKFHSLINDEFDMMVAVAANNVSTRYQGSNTNPEIKIHDLRVGGKGFDMRISIDNEYFNARAIPVEGVFVRFHYRYIIT